MGEDRRAAVVRATVRRAHGPRSHGARGTRMEGTHCRAHVITRGMLLEPQPDSGSFRNGGCTTVGIRQHTAKM